MAAWRTRAYDTFGIRPGSYSFREGKRDLFRDLVDWSRKAIQANDVDQIRKICDYVSWADSLHNDELDSVIDIAFFLQVFEDRELRSALEPFFSPDLITRMDKRLNCEYSYNQV